MGESARVASVAAVRGVIPAVVAFRESVQASLVTAEASSVRALDWVQKDRMAHWTREVRRRQELVTRAKGVLESKRPLDSDAPRTNVEAELALRKAKRALAEAESKLEQTRRWARALGEAAEKYRGAVAPLAWFASAELPKAVASLEAMGSALEAYLATGGPGEEAPRLELEEEDAGAGDAGPGGGA